MKKTLTLILALVMVLALSACSEKKADSSSEAVKLGFVDTSYIYDVVQEHQTEKHDTNDIEMVVYNNLSTSLLALDKGEVSMLWMNKTLADYIQAHNDIYEVYSGELSDAVEKHNTTTYGMLMMESNTELYELMNDSIKQFKADGTMDKLIENNLMAYITADPEPIELPHFEGAETYRIAMTGDLPPTDFVSADGKPAGFNAALLTAIANRAQVNFEFVPVDSGAKIVALTSGKVDAVFWMPYSYNCSKCGEAYEFFPEDTVLTESYFADTIVILRTKTTK